MIHEENKSTTNKNQTSSISTTINPYLENLIHTAWQLACTALWNNEVFSEKEKEEAKSAIKNYLLSATDAYQAYLVFCQRVLLTRQYINNSSNRYMPLPSHWLDKNNETGFAGTGKWYDKIKEVRASLPIYKIELKALAESILEMKEEPTASNFNYWRNYFIEKQAPGLLFLFLATLTNSYYGI
jgi:hypothetical protein